MRTLLLACALATVGWAADERFVTNPAGEIVPVALPVPAKMRNPWPEAWEQGLVTRFNHLLEVSKPNGKYGSTYFENEKQSYPNAFIDFAKGNREPALKFLQAKDNEPWSELTLGVDWFPGFTIRSQVRKYFFFGQYLDQDYRKLMFDSAKLWTEVDPLRRSNPHWKKEKAGWTPATMNSWVDVRATDNLRAMREVAVYLMAEETGNEDVRRIYAQRIQAYVTALYTTGMGEWDSANYLAHTMSAYLPLYDFAKDPEVRMLGKAALDYLSAMAAVNYYRGSVCGPNKRDYDNLGPYSGMAGEVALWFDDCPVPDSKPYRDFIHFATSGYRPPQAVVHLAQKHFPKPVEIWSSKPSYEGWFKKNGGEDKPETFLTYSFGDTWQMGSAPRGHQGDMNGFRLGTYSSTRGADTWVIASSLKGYIGISTGSNGADNVAQFGNQLIWLNRTPGTTLFLLMPKEAAISEQDGIVFFQAEKTWLALRPINTARHGNDTEATAAICESKNRFPDWQIWSLTGTADGITGLTLEIGDTGSHGSFADFRTAVLQKSALDLTALGTGSVISTASTGKKLQLTVANSGLPTVTRAGKVHDWADHWALWQGADAAPTPIRLDWKSGLLQVDAGGAQFEGRLQDGRYQFSEKGLAK